MLLCLKFFFTSIVKNTQYISFYEINIYNLTQTNLNSPIHYRMITSFMYPSKYLKYLLIYTLNITNFFTSSLRKRKINAKKRIHEITRRRSSEFATILEFQGEHQLFLSFSRTHEAVEYGGCPGNGNLRHESSPRGGRAQWEKRGWRKPCVGR